MLRGQYSEAEDGKLPPYLWSTGACQSQAVRSHWVSYLRLWDGTALLVAEPLCLTPPEAAEAPEKLCPCFAPDITLPHALIWLCPHRTPPKHWELKTCIQNQWKYFIWKPVKLDIWWGEARIPEKETVCRKVKLQLQKLYIAYSPHCLCLNSSTSTFSIHTPTHSTLHVLPFPSHPQINWLGKQSLCR